MNKNYSKKKVSNFLSPFSFYRINSLISQLINKEYKAFILKFAKTYYKNAF